MKKLIYMLAIVLILTACNNNVQAPQKDVNDADNQANTEKEVPSNTDKKLTVDDYKELKVNELGEIPVIMYHGLVDENPPTSYQRTREAFRKDLQYFYDNKYRLIAISDYIDNNINVEAGYTPLVLTFDDGDPTSFSLVEKDGKLVPTEGSAVDIIEKFAKAHPDFGKTATLFINGGESQFKGAGSYKQRLEYLVKNGFDIGNHTYSHKSMSKLSAQELQEEIGRVHESIKKALPDYNLRALTYPFGERPKTDELKKLVTNGEYNGLKYHYDIAFREGPSAPRLLPVTHIKFDYINVPRLRGADDDKNGADMGGYMKKYEKKPELRYISDGDSNTIVVPETEKDNVNKEIVGDKKIITY